MMRALMPLRMLPAGLGLLLLGCKPPPEEQNIRARALSYCENGVCLVVAAELADSDGDGVSNADEKAAGTDPNDPASRPPMRRLIDLAGTGRLPSFAERHSEIFVLPVLAPDGRPVVKDDPLAGGPPVPVRDALAGLGIKRETLARFGVAAEPALQIGLGPAAPADAGNDQPPVKVGGVDMALLAQGFIHLGKYEGSEMNRRPEPGTSGGTGGADGGTGGTGGTGGGPGNGAPDGGTPGAADGGTGGGSGGSEPGWFCKNLGWFCGRGDDDPAGNGVMVVEISAADLGRVKARLGSNSTPGPATGGPDVPTDPETIDDPLAPIAIYDPDHRDQGVIIVRPPGAAPNPGWNSNFGTTLVEHILAQKGPPPRGGTGCPSGQRC